MDNENTKIKKYRILVPILLLDSRSSDYVCLDVDTS